MNKGLLRRIFVLALCVGILSFGTVQAEESTSDSGWQFAVAAYLWGADIGGSTGIWHGTSVRTLSTTSISAVPHLALFFAGRG